MPLKESILKLMFDVFNLTQLKYGDLRSTMYDSTAAQLTDKWFPSRRVGLDRHEHFRSRLASAFYNVRCTDTLNYWYWSLQLIECHWQNLVELQEPSRLRRSRNIGALGAAEQHREKPYYVGRLQRVSYTIVGFNVSKSLCSVRWRYECERRDPRGRRPFVVYCIQILLGALHFNGTALRRRT